MNKTVADWQPIETAPRDGTEVLLCVDGLVRVGTFQQVPAEDLEGEPDNYSGWYACDCLSKTCEKVEPTEWAPKPDGPSH